MKSHKITTLCLLTYIIFTITSCQFINNDMNNAPKIVEAEKVFPIIYLLDNRQILHNPLLPYNHKMEPFHFNDQVSVLKREDDMKIYIENFDIENVELTLYTKETNQKIASTTITKNNMTHFIQGLTINVPIKPLLLNRYDHEFLLEITTKIEDQTLHYYTTLLIADTNQTAIINTVTKVHDYMINSNKKYANYLMGDNIDTGSFDDATIDSSENILLWKGFNKFIEIDDAIISITSYDYETNQFIINYDFNITHRIDSKYDYWRFIETYTCTIENNAVKILNFNRRGYQQLYIHNDEQLTLINYDNILNYATHTIVSENNQYTAFLYNKILWLYDNHSETLIRVFSFSRLNSDYIFDESLNHDITILNLTNEGNIDYIVYGYMPSGDLCGFNGMLLNTYDQNLNSNVSHQFIQLPLSTRQIEKEILNYNGSYNKTYHHYTFEYNHQLYEVSLDDHSFNHLTQLPNNIFYRNKHLIYSTQTSAHSNQSIKIINTNKHSFNINYIQNTDQYLRPVMTYNDYLIAGLYDIDNIYTTISSETFYPYSTLLLIDPEGHIINEYTANSGQYYHDITVTDTKDLYAHIYELSIIPHQVPRYSQIEYKDMGPLLIDTLTHVPHTPSKETTPLTEQSLANLSVTELINIEATTVNKNQLSELLPFNDPLYEVYINHQLQLTTTDYFATFKYINDMRDPFTIYKNTNGIKSVVYTNTEAIDSPHMIDTVPLYAQYPDLPRGCEVTSLSMFLSYHLNTPIDKMTLMNQIKIDETPYKTDKGYIEFGNMYDGFVGSMADGTVPGLGVYIPPIYQLAHHYIETNLYDLTGCDFSQIRYHLSHNRPVQVIVPSNYNEINPALIQTWHTPMGFMEVSFLEHSVVIVGYDNQYIYFNDPITGNRSKRTINQFKKAWEQQGSQAMVVID